jgi:ABC-type nickel/cobalt efflux system permease component RcnA
MRRIRDTGAMGALLTVAGIAFVYGVLHAVGPGHGKLVVSSFLLARDATVLGGVALSGLISLVQVLSSVALVSVLAFALGERGLGVLGRSVWLELVSYGAIVGVGLVMACSAVTGRDIDGHTEHGSEHPSRTSAAMVVAAGLTPCASAVILMLFALANEVFLVGLAASIIMAIGMGITVALVGVVTIAGRRSIVGTAAFRPRVVQFVRRGLAMTGSILVIVIGGLFFANAWTRLP